MLTENEASFSFTVDFSLDTKDAGKNDKHGDNSRSLGKAEKQMKDLEAKLSGATGTAKKVIEQKIKNIKRTA